MADAPSDPEANPAVEDRQPLLQNRDTPAETSSSPNIFQAVLQWSQSFRIRPILTRNASSGEDATPSGTSSETPPAIATASPFVASPLQAGSQTGSPSVGRDHLSKCRSRNDLESAALRRINSFCSEGSLKRVNGSCLICMETLSQEEFASGEAITLDCMCKGEMALRHKSCAEKWAQVKGSNVCDICKAPIANLPPLPVVDSDVEAATPDIIITDVGEQFEDALRRRDEIPAAADYIFDCIRVTWVSMIICILFFEFPVSKSFVTGLMIGIAYTAFCKAMHRSAQYRALASAPDSPHAAATLVLA